MPIARIRSLPSWPLLALVLIAVAGCEPSKPKPKSQPILGQRTQEIRDLKQEEQKGGVEKEPKITSKDPITLGGNAYVSIIGQTSILNIKHAIDLYEAENGSKPKTYDEFMEKIIRANNIALPKLPSYQEYGYDAEKAQLTIIEYPARKEAINYPKP